MAVPRFLLLLGFWLVLDGGSLTGLVVGVPTALLATACSLAMAGPPHLAIRWAGVPLLAVRFVLDSLVAAWDVALRALLPGRRLHPGILTFKCMQTSETSQNVFLGVASLMPGSLPVGRDPSGRVLVHCLDTRQPVAAQLASLENRLAKVIVQATPDA
jgi:multicomponent Na+:H+ antiporter subunit E